MTDTIFVTGASGHLGRAIIDSLLGAQGVAAADPDCELQFEVEALAEAKLRFGGPVRRTLPDGSHYRTPRCADR